MRASATWWQPPQQPAQLGHSPRNLSTPGNTDLAETSGTHNFLSLTSCCLCLWQWPAQPGDSLINAYLLSLTRDCLSLHIQIDRILLNCFLVLPYWKILRHYLLIFHRKGCSAILCVSAVMELLAVLRHNKPKTKKCTLRGRLWASRWGWVFLEQTQILSGIQFIMHFIDFFCGNKTIRQ